VCWHAAVSVNPTGPFTQKRVGGYRQCKAVLLQINPTTCAMHNSSSEGLIIQVQNKGSSLSQDSVCLSHAGYSHAPFDMHCYLLRSQEHR